MYDQILKQYFGYDSFRPLQREIIESVGAGRDTLALLPTGGGKSVCFQVPALAREGLCLVVTPLIALMKDQVDNLRRRDIKATAIYTGMSLDETRAVFDNCMFGDYKFLYVSPERLQSASFLESLAQLPVSMIAVDEAHCICQWGYDFRPAYLKIAQVRELFADAPVLALTATATPDVVDDIQERLLFREKNVIKGSFARNNISYIVRHSDDKAGTLLKILNAVGGSSIVYVRSRQRTKEVAEWLVNNGISATFYHAGLSNRDKDARQKAWKAYSPDLASDGTYRVMVATNAFGMGIDKAEVRTVVHLDLPDNIESYFQEAGRAGRDGQKAYAVLIYSDLDKQKLHKRVSDNYPDPDFVVSVYEHAANFLQVGEGSGLGHTFQFDLHRFCQERHLPLLPTYAALQLLDSAGYITWTDEQDTNPRVMMLTRREELYDYNFSQLQDRILHDIFRRYTGIFTEPQYINDELVATSLDISTRELNEQLIELAKRHVLTYIPRSHTPFLSYIREREDSSRIVLPEHVYDRRLDIYRTKLESMLEYATQDNFCRSQVLLSYFGETDAPACGTCDVCRKNKIEPQT